MELKIQLDAFEGPLDLLLHLIGINKIDIYDIPISQITEIYNGVIESNENIDINHFSDFIVMSATLLEIKSRMLLPSTFDMDGMFSLQEDPRSELVEKLLEYRKIKAAAESFFQRENQLGALYFRENQMDVPVTTKDYHLEEQLLIEAMKRILDRMPEKDQIRQQFFSKLERDVFSVEDKVNVITRLLEEKGRFQFDALFDQVIIKEEVIVTFLAVLELLKQNFIHVTQDNLYSTITIIKV